MSPDLYTLDPAYAGLHPRSGAKDRQFLNPDQGPWQRNCPSVVQRLSTPSDSLGPGADYTTLPDQQNRKDYSGSGRLPYDTMRREYTFLDTLGTLCSTLSRGKDLRNRLEFSNGR